MKNYKVSVEADYNNIFSVRALQQLNMILTIMIG